MPCIVLRKAATSLTVLAQVPARAQSFHAGHRKDTTLLHSCSTNPTFTPWQAQQRAGCSTPLALPRSFQIFRPEGALLAGAPHPQLATLCRAACVLEQDSRNQNLDQTSIVFPSSTCMLAIMRCMSCSFWSTTSKLDQNAECHTFVPAMSQSVLTCMLAIMRCMSSSFWSTTLKAGPGFRPLGSLGAASVHAVVSSRHSHFVTAARPASPCRRGPNVCHLHSEARRQCNRVQMARVSRSRRLRHVTLIVNPYRSRPQPLMKLTQEGVAAAQHLLRCRHSWIQAELNCQGLQTQGPSNPIQSVQRDAHLPQQLAQVGVAVPQHLLRRLGDGLAL